MIVGWATVASPVNIFFDYLVINSRIYGVEGLLLFVDM
jgi:hypothetical protein